MDDLVQRLDDLDRDLRRLYEQAGPRYSGVPVGPSVGPVPDHETGTIVRAPEEKLRLVQEVVDAREEILRSLDEAGLYYTAGQVHWDLTPNRLAAHRGLTVLNGHIAIFREAEGEPEEEVVTHPIRGILRNPDGSPKTKMRRLFQSPPFAQVNFDGRHDGTNWSWELQVVDLQHGVVAAREPVFISQEDGPAIRPLLDRTLPAFLSRIGDLS